MESKELFYQMISGRVTPRIEKIEEFTSRYPWCAVGHKSLFTALCGQSDEAYLSYVSKASVYLFNREALYSLAHTARTHSFFAPEPVQATREGEAEDSGKSFKEESEMSFEEEPETIFKEERVRNLKEDSGFKEERVKNLKEDSGKNLNEDSRMNLKADSGMNLKADSRTSLKEDSGMNFKEESEMSFEEDSETIFKEERVKNLKEDSGKNLNEDSRMNLKADSGMNLKEDSGKNLKEDSGKSLKEDSGKNLKEDSEMNDDEFEMIPDIDLVKPIIMVAGDYFGQEVISSALLEEKNAIDKFIKTKPKLAQVQIPHEEKGGTVHTYQEEQREKELKVSLQDVGEDNFMTETLARIYVDQSLYQLAIEAYQKLILLYPKKSDYFAPLIQELKYKMVR